MSAELPEDAWLAALLALEKMGPNRLVALLATQSARTVWEQLCDGSPITAPGVNNATVAHWRTIARRFDVRDRWAAMQGLGISAAAVHGPAYPGRLRDDPEPPHLVFWSGQKLDIDTPTVAIVGTRKCTSYGLRVAHDFGAELGAAGVSVVSGLALGIDASAHRGALSVSGGAPPIGVVGSGLDVVYPRRNRGLWSEVAERGTLLSECPPGTEPSPWRFPARNRIIAGLSDAVIVIESRGRGGSLITVDEAQLRDVPVGAVPGPITAASSIGCNALLADGAVPVLSAADVLGMIGHVSPSARPKLVPVHSSKEQEDSLRRSADVLSPETATVLEAIEWQPVLIEQLCLRLGKQVTDIAPDVERLVAAGLCTRSGPWIERVA